MAKTPSARNFAQYLSIVMTLLGVWTDCGRCIVHPLAYSFLKAINLERKCFQNDVRPNFLTHVY